MSLHKYEFNVPPDLEKDLKEAGLYAEDTEVTRIIKEPIITISPRIRQRAIEEAPLAMPSLGDFINPEANLEPPFHVFQELPERHEPEPDQRAQLIRDITAMKPAMRGDESFSDMRHTFDMLTRLELFCDGDPPELETMLWARMAAYRIAGMGYEQADAVYTTFMTDYAINPDVIDSSDSSLVDDADRWVKIIKATDPVQYGHIQACVDFIRPQSGDRTIVERMVSVTLLQISHYREMADLDTTSAMFRGDIVDPLGVHRYRAPKVGHRGFDVTSYTPGELAEHQLIGDLLADSSKPYDPATNNIIFQADDTYAEPEFSDKQKMLFGLLDVAAIALEERKHQEEIRSKTADMTRRMGYVPTDAAVEKAYIVRHAVHHMLGLNFTEKVSDITVLYDKDVYLSDMEWVVWAKKLLNDLHGNEEFETVILPGITFLLPDDQERALGHLIAAVTYDQIRHYRATLACEKGHAVLDAEFWQLAKEPETFPEAREEPSLDVIRHGLAATGFTPDQLVRLPLRELLWNPRKPPHPVWNRIRRQKKPEYNDPEMTESQKFALDILKVRKRADEEIVSGSAFAYNSADMARKLIGKKADMHAFKLTHRARLAATLICGLGGFHAFAEEIYKIHTDVAVMTDGRPPLASVADDAQIDLYQYDSTAKTIEACILLLGDTEEDDNLLRSALCLAINQIKTWRLRKESE